MPTAAIVLAAGGSRRLGRTKQVEPWGDTTLLGRVLVAAKEMPVDEIWVVLGADSERILSEVDFGDAGVVENPEWEEGIASSLRVGLDALTRLSRAERALILMGDQPDVSPEVVTQLLDAPDGSRRGELGAALRVLMRHEPDGPIEVPERVTVYRTIVHDDDRCLGCGTCARTCPAGAIEARPPEAGAASAEATAAPAASGGEVRP